MEGENNNLENEVLAKQTLDDLLESKEYGEEARILKNLLLVLRTLIKQDESEKGQFIFAIAEFLLTEDVTGSEGGHFHDLSQLVAKVFDKDSEFRQKFVTDEDFRKEIENEEIFTTAVEKFIALHEKIAHGGNMEN